MASVGSKGENTKSSVPIRNIVNQPTASWAGGIFGLIFISRQRRRQRIASTADEIHLRSRRPLGRSATRLCTPDRNGGIKIGAIVRADKVHRGQEHLLACQRAPLLRARRRAFRIILSK